MFTKNLKFEIYTYSYFQMSTFSGYGLTECVAGFAISPFRGHTPSGSVGKIVPEIEARIVDPETGRDVRPGESGELLFRGHNVMRGYFRKPDRTAATIESNGFMRTGNGGLCL